jgi:hypothetical protein
LVLIQIWQLHLDIKLIFYIQKVQRNYFEKENDPIYWFIVFNRFNTFIQEGYFLVSDFINEEQFIKYKNDNIILD